MLLKYDEDLDMSYVVLCTTSDVAHEYLENEGYVLAQVAYACREHLQVAYVLLEC